MEDEPKFTDLEQLLDRLDEVGRESETVSLDAILGAVGRRSFGPLLLVAGLITLAPIIGDIPGVPTLMGIIVFLVAIQLLFQRKHVWLPHWLLKRSVSRGKITRALKWMRRPARFVDRWLQPRLPLFTRGLAYYAVAVLCLLIALAMPVMELVPFSANAAGLVLTAFGLALIAGDGLLVLIGVAVMAIAGALIGYQFV